MAFIHRLGLDRKLARLSSVVRPVLNAPAERRLARALNCSDLRDCAAARAHRMIFDYLDGGCDDEIALRRSHSAYADLEMHYNVLAGHAPPLDLTAEAFGRPTRLPFFLCPTAGQRMFHADGEAAVASVAGERGMLYGLSTLATTPIVDVAAVLPPELPKVFQLYLWADKGLVRDMLDAAREAGYTAIALTADAAWFGNRERDGRNGFSVPPSYSARQVWEAVKRPAWTWDLISTPVLTYANMAREVPAEAMADFVGTQFKHDFDWKDAEWLRGEWEGALALKGVVRPDDAVRALSSGFDTVWVSNHGGRQLETSPATIDVLPAIRAAVGPDAEVLVDGGVMRGTDIVKALALGANGVGIGRAYLYGLAAGGGAGVARAVDILTRELECAMGLLGVGSVTELRERGAELVRRQGDAWPR